jgi:hypothetical protein
MSIVIGAALAAAASTSPASDFGAQRDDLLRTDSEQLFGITKPVGQSSTRSIDAATAEANPEALLTVAAGLHVRVVNASAKLGPNADQMVLWPNDENPTHLIMCNEEDTGEPAVQRVGLDDGVVATILTGLESCDPVRRTPWGTIIVAEEVSDTGHLVEIIKPLGTTGATINTATGQTSSPNVVDRPAVGRLAFEGFALYPNGVLYFDDERRPDNGNPGGAFYKFIPEKLWTPGQPSITNLNQSPLTGGSVYGLRIGLRSDATDYGPGSDTGMGKWIKITNANNADLAAEAAKLSLTAYYRPEDSEIDRNALTKGNVRFCTNNTGNQFSGHNWGETVCITDGKLGQAGQNNATPELQRFVIGTPAFAMMDNIAFQPGRGNWVMNEDGESADFETPRNNDLWACLPDGTDADALSDGCVRIATLNDTTAESTGGIFDATGKRYFVSIQHNVTGHGVILEITGWH